MLLFSTSRRTGAYTWFSMSYASIYQESTEPVNIRPHRCYAPPQPLSMRLSRSASTQIPQFEISNIWSNGLVTLTLRGNHWRTWGAAAMICWVNTMLWMACESTGGWNGCVDSVEELTGVVRKGRVWSATMTIMLERVRETSSRQNIRWVCWAISFAIDSGNFCWYLSHSGFSRVMVRDPPNTWISSNTHRLNFRTWALLNFSACHSFRITKMATSGTNCLLNAVLTAAHLIS